jgi:phage shock protein A
MSGLKNASACEAFEEMAGRIEQIEAEAEATAEMSEEFSGDMLAHKFSELETTQGSEDELLSLKRKMGLAPPEPAAAEAEAPSEQVRVDEEFAALNDAEQEELARALAELDAEEQASLRVQR